MEAPLFVTHSYGLSGIERFFGKLNYCRQEKIIYYVSGGGRWLKRGEVRAIGPEHIFIDTHSYDLPGKEQFLLNFNKGVAKR
jgi:hypothetical protein